jgi:pimeloyl-ACP methyl ester carboxylesterase
MPTVNTGSVNIYYQQEGRGEALLFVHGSGADHTLWSQQHQALKNEYRVASLDLNGHGQSPRREGAGLATYTEDVLAVMEALQGPIVLLGHSLGGAVALNIALRQPKNLRAVGLIGTGAKLRVHPQILAAIATDFPSAIELLLNWEFREGTPQELREQRRAQMARNGQASLHRDFTTCDGFNVMDRLGEIRVPALIVCGRDDKLTPVKYSQYLKDQLREVRFEVIEAAGHNVMIEQPDALNRVIREFAREL